MITNSTQTYYTGRASQSALTAVKAAKLVRQCGPYIMRVHVLNNNVPVRMYDMALRNEAICRAAHRN